MNEQGLLLLPFARTSTKQVRAFCGGPLDLERPPF